MFTGIVEEIGKIVEVRKGVSSSKLVINGKKIFCDLDIGDSVAVNGVCLTAAGISGNTFTADVMSETLIRSSLGRLKKGSNVNIERAMSANGRFGGHIVSGHIDGIGHIIAIAEDDNAVWYRIAADDNIMRYVVLKGSIAIDGISLTVAKLEKDNFSVSIIPHTRQQTILSQKGVGDIVNLENDIIGKYIERLLLPNSDNCGIDNHNSYKQQKANISNTITEEFLINNGF